MLQKSNKKISWRAAATSCVWPETALINCRRLARSVPEVGLYLLELQSCLRYGPNDLPQKTYGLTYHAHLPLDLPWRLGGETAFYAMEGLLEKTAHLKPWAFVLHPPENPAALQGFLQAFADTGHDPKSVLLENTETASPADVLEMATEAGCGVCLDLGHMLAMDHALPKDAPGLIDAVRMLHVYSPFGVEGPPPGRRHAHRTLTCLSPEGRETLLWMLSNLCPETVVVEVFAPIHLLESLAVLDALATGSGVGA
ncbi:MAG: cobamide remodeling phosphodiesterase CbiR [Solidesulfovibrio sp.]